MISLCSVVRLEIAVADIEGLPGSLPWAQIFALLPAVEELWFGSNIHHLSTSFASSDFAQSAGSHKLALVGNLDNRSLVSVGDIRSCPGDVHRLLGVNIGGDSGDCGDFSDLDNDVF